ncbi:MAG: BON domain-containing protein [Bacteroidetes bacterium]|nr:BON domain-containing protein [Bacteroidota bacterium]
MKTLKNMAIKPIIMSILLGACMMSADTYAQDNKIDDQEITMAINNELMFTASVPAYMVDVATKNGIVTLTGTTNNILAKERAVKVAQSIKGVRGVVNNLEVDPPLRSDYALEKDVNEALLYDPATDSYEINTKVKNGVVSLDGTVQSWQEKELAAHVVKSVKGVKQLENNIIVNYTSNRKDYEIQKEIEQALQNDVRVDDALIEVEVNDGHVNLEGAVGSASEREQAMADSWVAGVKHVAADNLDVSDWARDEDMRNDKYVYKPDDQIKEAVKDALYYDPRVYSFNPTVKVTDGVVTLSGVVDNVKAKNAAEQDAKNVVGVWSVKNYIKVRPTHIPEDAELTGDIKSALMRDPFVENYQVDVSVDNGVVYLTGKVNTDYEKEQAENIVSRINGVIAIENNLQLEKENKFAYDDYLGWDSHTPPVHFQVDDTYQSDWEIKNNINDQLYWSPYVNEEEVEITVDNGVAVLEGDVDTRREKLYAEVNAYEGGADEVKNKLNVEYSPND